MEEPGTALQAASRTINRVARTAKYLGDEFIGISLQADRRGRISIDVSSRL
ncbi:hypothetical protein ALP16_101310 [Pseudomonas savastanoi]|uniref:Uncharacterized protein n=1 Tax=Pseudomonas savastanoi TaxID=29438 RepID=A0A3M6A536_PSESS|nr:hypothetical protein AC519_2616 [Pseudomonas savastanoi]KPC49823.1 Unknown protein sequence [Pseudomonas amygdali pv. morsprunorum]RMS69858.1 hypothetical protein ALP61_100208 [Pseudomonas savastanoi]RMV14423.1 hypothetical protein ALP16_101310 [Pseudomonas savastanoi]